MGKTIKAIASASIVPALLALWLLAGQEGALRVLQVLLAAIFLMLAFLMWAQLTFHVPQTQLPARTGIQKYLAIAINASAFVLLSWNDQALTGLAVIVTAVMGECLRERVKGGRDA